jgi:glutamate-1-semialdehyde 2,1-aminomutase
VAAITAAAARGTTFGAPTEGEVELAELIERRVPGISMVRMTSSGTEASMSAIRLARAATGRDKLLKFAGAYHGHVDGLLAQAGSGLATQAIPASPGVPDAATAATVIVPWNDHEAVMRATAEHELAAIIAEPFAANMGLVPPAQGFLELLRERASATGALLIFDEVITGFRVACGGAQELTAVLPDLTIMGKVIGGGLPAAAYGGPRELMERIAPAGDVYQAGTLSGNPLAVAAGLATIRALADRRAYARLETLGARLEQGWREGARKAGVPLTVNRVGSMLTAFFCAGPVRDYASARQADTASYARFFQALLARGVYLAPSQFEAAFVSLAHSEADLAAASQAAAEAFSATT